jgi:hypothetical protein
MLRRFLNRRYLPVVATALFLAVSAGAYFVPTTPAYACASKGSPGGNFFGWLGHRR